MWEEWSAVGFPVPKRETLTRPGCRGHIDLGLERLRLHCQQYIGVNPAIRFGVRVDYFEQNSWASEEVKVCATG